MRQDWRMPHTLVCFHAHPDDEALLTAGTMAKAAAAGHRVVLVVATRGEVGEVGGDFLGRRRGPGLAPLGRAGALGRHPGRGPPGVAGLRRLGIGPAADRPDPASGPPATWLRPARPTRFVEADADEAAGRLAAILVEEQADVLTTYDPNGGYGHPDHVQVHDVGAAGRPSWPARRWCWRPPSTGT